MAGIPFPPRPASLGFPNTVKPHAQGTDASPVRFRDAEDPSAGEEVQSILNDISPAVIDTRGWSDGADGKPAAAMPLPGGAPMRFEPVR